MKKIGFDYVCVSSGGIIPKTNLKIKNGFNVDLAKIIKKQCKIIVRTSGMINSVNFANKLIKDKYIDLICIGRKFISEPNFLIKQMNKKIKQELIPNQYKRCI